MGGEGGVVWEGGRRGFLLLAVATGFYILGKLTSEMQLIVRSYKNPPLKMNG